MKRLIPIFVIAMLCFASLSFAGEAFPNLELSGKLSDDQKAYLGVTSDTFKLSDIKAEYLFIEGYSMYCPICQRDAPHLNKLYDAVSKKDTAGKIKVIGLALGNTPYEVAFYQKKYNVEFPLFMDEDYTIHKALQEVPTPTFYIVKLGSEHEVVFKKIGEAKDEALLLKAIEDATGIK